MNLIQAYTQLGDQENGFRLLNDLKALNRLDLISHLEHYENALRNASINNDSSGTNENDTL